MKTSILTFHSNATTPFVYVSPSLQPYTRVTPFTIGVLLGILLVDYQFINTKLPRRTAQLLMLTSLTAILAVVYVDYLNFAHHPRNDRGNFTDEQNAAYQAGGRLIFAMAVSCVTWLCVTGHGGPVKTFLSLAIWEPLGKLTYGAYLIHPIVVRVYYYQKVQLFHFDPTEQAMYFVAVTVMTYAIAAVLHVMVELPFANLNKIIFPHPNAKRTTARRRTDDA
jgi:peptidoglycan/LPS O-acetylase OafA/YrhL